TFTIEGRIGSGRKTCTTPSITSRVLAPGAAMLLVQALLHGEGDPQANLPGVDRAVLHHGGDAGDVGLADALDRRGGTRDGEADGILDRVRGRAGQGDRPLDP